MQQPDLPANANTPASQAPFRELIEHAGDGFFVLGADRLLAEVNQALCELVGYSREELLGKSPVDFATPDSQANGKARLIQIDSTRSRTYQIELRRKDGSACPVLIRSITQRDAQGHLVGSLGFVTDLSEIINAQKSVAESERDLRGILDNMLDTYYRTNAQGQLVRASASAEYLLGYKPEQLIGMNIGDFYAIPSDRDRFLATLAANGGVVRHYEAQLKRRDGSIVWVSTNARVLTGEDGKTVGVEGTTRDITELKKAQEHIHFLANHDSLTELPNRRYFRERVDQVLRNADAATGTLALLFVDLDHFKQVNDLHGHDIGDDILRGVAQRLISAVRAQDIVCRHGGDEFLVAIADFPDQPSLVKRVEKLVQTISGSYLAGSKQFDVSCTVGVAVSPHDGLDCDTLMRRADFALYQAKGKGRRHFALFNDTGAAAN